ncbi:phosphonate metabolism protein/1,5-bisphosphokinase (PRPP-forming) PhnN [Comamonas sp. NoAH]|uniref:phosphonate metabolism protein/1,5-bisphosphokinase (PRPP-forming) PhnN n=1 Tax=Comamonas halotolerans TaxID=3041496 RepID=UPI0024E12391|nr:phosphonate metabolism protein/1,5-bisphosphokinase (PRPP-forming) PhnN [Comamonas sp. NoAH]
MTGRLIYVIGPSGAGKDSVLQGLRSQWPGHIPVHWACRTITRPATPHGECHEAVDKAGFEQMSLSNAFALQWRANGLAYGVRHEEVRRVMHGHWVFVNGSRAYLPELLQFAPQATVVHISASPEVLKSRLLARGRESEAAVSARMQRAVELELPPTSIQIMNDGVLEDAVINLRKHLMAEQSKGVAD